MSPQHSISEFTCSHGNQEIIDVLDYLNVKLKFHLCKDCQKIPEFAELIVNNKIKKDVEIK